MAEIVVNLLTDKLTTLIQEEVQGVKEEAVWIKDKLEHINALLIAADEMEDRSPGLDVWIKQLRDMAYDIEDAIDEFRLLTHHPDHESHAFLTRKLSTIKKFIARHQMAAEIQRINSRIQSISDGHDRFQSKTIDAKISAKTWDDHRQNALLIEEADLVGIENPKKQLVSWLIRDDTGREVVSVVGMRGLGKTTLVKEVYDDAQVKLQFRFRAWITVSQSFKMEELLKHMLQQLYRVKRRPVPLELDSMTNDQLRTQINRFLQHKTKRYLIVLDDLWGIEEWDAVKYAFPNSNSSRVMLTTRNYDVASASCKEFHGNVYSLNPLPLEESRTLFCRKTFGENSCPPYLNNLTESILKRCEGLPLAIVAISGVLATKDRLDEWDMIKRSLADELKENPRLSSMEKILLLSYKDLPYYLKSCFLYFSIFPKNHVIDQMRLIRLWIAEGFVRTKDNMTLEEVAQGYLNELLNRSLIQVAETTSEGRIKTCRVHDLLREIIIYKVREQNFVTIARGQNTEWPEKVRRLSIHKTMPDVLQSQSISHLRSLHIFWRVDSLSESLKSLSFPLEFKLLNVLDLRGAPLEVFPNEIINMFLLKYLSLRSTMIKIIPPTIGNLRYLETLDLKYTCITALPVEILKLQKLRHLLVYRYEIQSYAQINSRNGFKAMAQIGCLHSLQKLCHIDADHGSNVILRELGKLDQLRRLGIVRFRREHGITLCTSIEMLKRLRSLSITSIEENEVLDLESLSCPPPFLQRLYLSGRLEKLPHWMSSLHCLAKMSLNWSQLRDDPLEFLQDLPNLVHLEFLQVYEGETLHFNAGGFQRLKVLSLDKLDGLKMVIVEKGAMSSLEKLILQRCKLLHSLPSGIEHLRKLKSLEFCGMPNELIMTLRPDIDGGDYWKVKHVPEINTDDLNLTGILENFSAEEENEKQVLLWPQGMVFDTEAVEMTSNSSKQTKSEIEGTQTIHHIAEQPHVSSFKGQWQKGRLIGRGTFGGVYLAMNRETGALCAMKEVDLIPDDPKSAECVMQLEQEIKILGQLKHPNIVQYYGSEIIDDHFYIYLEYVHPGSVNKYVQEHFGAMTESVVRNFTRHILSGLAYLHSTKTIHRDIKGANLLVDASGVVKLADIGVAKHLTGQSYNLSLKGSPYWMAPEVMQATLNKDVNPDLTLAVDIWSLGCTIIEMLNGKPPWSDFTGPEAMFKVLNRTPPIPETLSSEGKDFLHCCFRGNPAERSTAMKLLEHPFVQNTYNQNVAVSMQAFSAEEGNEKQILLLPQRMVFDTEAVEMISNSSKRTKSEIEVIEDEASQRWPEGLQVEEMQQEAISTLKPQGVFDVEADKMPESGGQMKFPIADKEMGPEADRPEEAQQFLMQVGLRLTEPPKDEDWENANEIYLMDNELSVLPENPRCPKLSALFLQRNYKLRLIPPSFFDCMPALQTLNLSGTNIKSLPDSIIRLVSLKRLFLNDCHCFTVLSPKIGELKQLEVLSLEGTEIMDLPLDIKKLTNLTCLEVSFCEFQSNCRQAMQLNAVVPCGVISVLSQLEELSIDVDPGDERWDACVEDVVNEVCTLKSLYSLKFYFQRVELLSHIQWNIPSLLYFRFTVGRHVKRIMSGVPRDVEFELERWDRCLKYVNGVDVPRDIKKVLQHATAFFLDRHATVKKLSNFGIQNMEKLKCLVMGECSEVQVIIDEADGYEEDDSNEIVSESYGTEKIVLGSLEYMYVYYMESLRSMWEGPGPLQPESFFCLKSLTLCTCPQLTTIFTPGLLANLCNLEELKVDDCPSIKSIVSHDITAEHEICYFLPELKKISLHYMPELVSISNGLHIAPKLEWLSFYNCPNLKNPFVGEVSSQCLKKIKGETSWWEALEWSNGRPGYLDKIFVPIDIWDC